MKKIDIIGERFGKLVVISEHSTTRNGHSRYTCLCDCGNHTNVLKTHLRRGNTKSCGCETPIGRKHHQWGGVGEMSGNFWNSHIVRSASGDKGRRIPIELSITKEYVWNLFLKQDRKCALSGLEIKFPRVHKDRTYTASLDRIDSGLGYIEGNVQWVHKMVNIMKNKFNQQNFIDVCKLIAENN